MRASLVGMVAVGVLSAAILSRCGSASESSTLTPTPVRQAELSGERRWDGELSCMPHHTESAQYGAAYTPRVYA